MSLPKTKASKSVLLSPYHGSRLVKALCLKYDGHCVGTLSKSSFIHNFSLSPMLCRMVVSAILNFGSRAIAATIVLYIVFCCLAQFFHISLKQDFSTVRVTDVATHVVNYFKTLMF